MSELLACAKTMVLLYTELTANHTAHFIQAPALTWFKDKDSVLCWLLH